MYELQDKECATLSQFQTKLCSEILCTKFSNCFYFFDQISNISCSDIVSRLWVSGTWFLMFHDQNLFESPKGLKKSNFSPKRLVTLKTLYKKLWYLNKKNRIHSRNIVETFENLVHIISERSLRPYHVTIFASLKLQLHDVIYRLRFYSNSLIHILSLSNSHNNVASIQES